MKNSRKRQRPTSGRLVLQPLRLQVKNESPGRDFMNDEGSFSQPNERSNDVIESVANSKSLKSANNENDRDHVNDGNDFESEFAKDCTEFEVEKVKFKGHDRLDSIMVGQDDAFVENIVDDQKVSVRDVENNVRSVSVEMNSSYIRSNNVDSEVVNGVEEVEAVKIKLEQLEEDNLFLKMELAAKQVEEQYSNKHKLERANLAAELESAKREIDLLKNALKAKNDMLEKHNSNIETLEKTKQSYEHNLTFPQNIAVQPVKSLLGCSVSANKIKDQVIEQDLSSNLSAKLKIDRQRRKEDFKAYKSNFSMVTISQLSDFIVHSLPQLCAVKEGESTNPLLVGFSEILQRLSTVNDKLHATNKHSGSSVERAIIIKMEFRLVSQRILNFFNLEAFEIRHDSEAAQNLDRILDISMRVGQLLRSLIETMIHVARASELSETLFLIDVICNLDFEKFLKFLADIALLLKTSKVKGVRTNIRSRAVPLQLDLFNVFNMFLRSGLSARTIPESINFITNLMRSSLTKLNEIAVSKFNYALLAESYSIMLGNLLSRKMDSSSSSSDSAKLLELIDGVQLRRICEVATYNQSLNSLRAKGFSDERVFAVCKSLQKVVDLYLKIFDDRKGLVTIDATNITDQLFKLQCSVLTEDLLYILCVVLGDHYCGLFNEPFPVKTDYMVKHHLKLTSARLLLLILPKLLTCNKILGPVILGSNLQTEQSTASDEMLKRRAEFECLDELLVKLKINRLSSYGDMALALSNISEEFSAMKASASLLLDRIRILGPSD